MSKSRLSGQKENKTMIHLLVCVFQAEWAYLVSPWWLCRVLPKLALLCVCVFIRQRGGGEGE